MVTIGSKLLALAIGNFFTCVLPLLSDKPGLFVPPSAFMTVSRRFLSFYMRKIGSPSYRRDGWYEYLKV